MTMRPSAARPEKITTPYITGACTLVAQRGAYMVLKFAGRFSGTSYRRRWAPAHYALVVVVDTAATSVTQIDYTDNSTHDVPAEKVWVKTLDERKPGRHWQRCAAELTAKMHELAEGSCR
jgi:hypothetical protein